MKIIFQTKLLSPTSGQKVPFLAPHWFVSNSGNHLRGVTHEDTVILMPTATSISNFTFHHNWYKVGKSKHKKTLLRCKVSKDRQHVSALFFYKAIIRSDIIKFCCVLTYPPYINCNIVTAHFVSTILYLILIHSNKHSFPSRRRPRTPSYRKQSVQTI